MSTVDALAARLGSTWYHRLLVVSSFAGGFLFSTLALRGHVALGIVVGGGIAGTLVGLRFLTDRPLIDEREAALSKTVAQYTFCVVGCGGAALFVGAIALEQLGVIVVTERMVGVGIGLTALFVVYLAVDTIVRWRA